MELKTIRERRSKIINEIKLEFKKDSEAILHRMKELQEQGKADEVTAELEKFINKWSDHLDEDDLNSKLAEQRNIEDINLPWKFGDMFFQNDFIFMKRNNESERDKYSALSKIYRPTEGTIVKKDVMDNAIWKDYIRESAFTISIYDKASNEFIGYCSIQNLAKIDWEISIELYPEWCGKGYGYIAVKTLIDNLYQATKNRFFRAKIDVDNVASQKIFKKLGFYPNGISEFMLHGKELEQFRKDNLSIINDDIREVSKEFGMEPEDIIGYTLEYRLDMERQSQI